MTAGASPTRDAGAALLRGGTVPAAAAGGLAVLVSAAWGWGAAVAALLGAGLATAALAVGPALLSALRNASPPAVTAAAAGGYAAVVVLLGLVLVLLPPADWLPVAHLAAALVVATVAGVAGQARAVTRLRVLAYGSDAGAATAERGGVPSAPPDGDAAESPQVHGR